MEIQWVLSDGKGNPLTGGSAETALRLRRESDGFLLDWDDMIFKAAGWSAVTAALEEIDAVNYPGAYRKVIDCGEWDDGCYNWTAHYNGSPRRNGFGQAWIANGADVNDGTLGSIAAAIAALNNLSTDQVIQCLWGKTVIDRTTGGFTVYGLDGATVLVTGTIVIGAASSARTPDS